MAKFTQFLCSASLILALTDVASAQLRQVPPSAERGPPPGAQFVPIPVVPLPSGPMRHPNKFRPAQPPPKPPPTTTTTTTVQPPPPTTPPQTLPPTEETKRPITTTTTTTTPPPTQPLTTPTPEELLTTSTTTTVKPEEPNVSLVFSENYRSDDGSYLFDYEAANSVAQREQGFVKHENGLDVIVKKGYYRFVGPDGRLFRVDYLADENGFQATGDHLPNGRFPAFILKPRGPTQKSTVTYPPANY